MLLRYPSIETEESAMPENPGPGSVVYVIRRETPRWNRRGAMLGYRGAHMTL